MSNTGNPYETLGLDRGSSEKAIKKAYFRLVREHSPEKDPGRFKEIRSAYEMLQDRKARARLDISALAEPRRGFRSYEGSSPAEFEPDAGELLSLDPYCDLKRTQFRDDWQDPARGT